MRARTIRRILWVLGFGCLWLPIVDDPPLATAPYVQNVTGDAITVAMITASPVQLHCEVRDPKGALVATAEDSAARRRHGLRLGKLSPGTSYTYVVSNGEEAVGNGSFRTPPADDLAPVKFAFVGDSGGQPWWVWLQTAPILHFPARWQWFGPAGSVARIGADVAAYEPDFLLHLGDLVYPWGRHCHYSSGFFRPFADALRNAPCYPALGNHDVMDTGGLQTLANFHLPTNEVTGDSRCYSFAYGSVRVISLEFADMFGLRVEPGHPSLAYLEAELPRCSEPWVVVMSHYPMLSASRQDNRADLMLHLRPLLEKYAVSLYLSGHDHCYQRFGPSPGGAYEVPLIVSGGGGKSLYEVHPKAGAIVLESVYHWCSVAVNGPRLRLLAHDIDGRVFDDLSLQLVADDRLAKLRASNPARAGRIAAILR